MSPTPKTYRTRDNRVVQTLEHDPAHFKPILGQLADRQYRWHTDGKHDAWPTELDLTL